MYRVCFHCMLWILLVFSASSSSICHFCVLSWMAVHASPLSSSLPQHPLGLSHTKMCRCKFHISPHRRPWSSVTWIMLSFALSLILILPYTSVIHLLGGNCKMSPGSSHLHFYQQDSNLLVWRRVCPVHALSFSRGSVRSPVSVLRGPPLTSHFHPQLSGLSALL